MSLHLWLSFAAASALISFSPGAGAILSMSTGLRHGLRRGIWSILGMQLGLLGNLVLVAAGLGAILAGSAEAFTAIKWTGVAYLLYLAVRQWRSVPAAFAEGPNTSVPDAGRYAMLWRGFAVNATNPKAILFLLAILPQFLDTTRPLAPQYAIMAATMSVIDVVVMSGYTHLASKAANYLRSRRAQRVTGRVFSGLFVGAATVLATVDHA